MAVLLPISAAVAGLAAVGVASRLDAMLLIALPTLALAWGNGANDVSKGVASLIGSGVADPRHALWWGTLWSVLGGLTALAWGSALLDTFAHGLLAPDLPVAQSLIAAALIGATAWVLLASRFGWPVSTTHALLGGIAGATLGSAGTAGLQFGLVASKALLPLLISPLIALALSWTLLAAASHVVARMPPRQPGCNSWERGRKALIALHWGTSGATSFARALNDVPKIAALASLAVAAGPEHAAAGAADTALIAVTAAMGIGSLWGGMRVCRVLAHRVARIDAARGFLANLSTSFLVLAGSHLGLPLSTTHVSTGALVGIRCAQRQQPGTGDTLRAILFAWIITLPAAAAVAAAAAFVLGVPR